MKTYISFIFGWCVIFACLIFFVKALALDPNFYINEYRQMNVSDSLDVSDADLNRSITVLLDYLNNDRNDIKLIITRNGKRTPAFGYRETTHMQDVKALYQNALRIGYGSVGLGIVLLLYVYRQKNGGAYLTKGVLRASLCFLVFIVFLGLWIATDFTDFWIRFHHVFFRNEYWLLTPGVDFMIDMLPESVFYALVIRILLWIVGLLAVINGICLYYQRRKVPIGFEVE